MSQLVGPGAIAEAGATSIIFSTPFPHKPGDKGRDKDGNEYVAVQYGISHHQYLEVFNCVDIHDSEARLRTT